MPTYQALTPSTHRGKRWKRYTDYRFAAADTLAPLVVLMLPPYSSPRPSRNKPPGPLMAPAALVRPAAS